jgi:hypothetical protein
VLKGGCVLALTSVTGFGTRRSAVIFLEFCNQYVLVVCSELPATHVFVAKVFHPLLLGSQQHRKHSSPTLTQYCKLTEIADYVYPQRGKFVTFACTDLSTREVWYALFMVAIATVQNSESRMLELITEWMGFR